jgi:hypothetical protein
LTVSQISRRRWLRGAGGTLVALPFLESFASAQEAGGVFPKRLVVFMHPHGTVADRWRPATTGAGYAFTDILRPLEAQRDRMLVLSGIDNIARLEQKAGNGHNPPGRTLFSCMPFSGSFNPDGTLKPAGQQPENGSSAGPSFEQLIASRQASTRFRRLDFCTPNISTAENQCFWGARDVPINAEGNPRAALQRIFSGVQATPSQEPTPLELLQRQRGSILDTVRESFNDLNRRAPAEDRARLQAHAQQIQELERQVQNVPTQFGSGCAPPTLQLPGGFSEFAEGSLPEASTAFMDMVAMSLACDLTRVVTLQFTEYNDPKFAFLGLQLPRAPFPTWHEMIHTGMNDAAVRQDVVTGFTYYMERLNYLLAALARVPEGNGSLLDNTLVVAMSEFGDGSIHSSSDLPVILAGNLGGQLRSGRHVAYSSATTGDLFTTLLNLYGGTDTSFGLTRGADGSVLSSGTLTDLTV